MIKKCIICSDFIPRASVICRKCEEKLEKSRFDSFMVRCPVCFHPLVDHVYECSWCIRFKGFRVYSVYDYSSCTLRHCLESFKFRGQSGFATLFAWIMNGNISHLGIRDPVLVPVPCSSSGFRKRGWDHMKKVCSILKGKYGYSVSYLISSDERIETQQKNMSATQRASVSSKRFVYNGSNRVCKNRRIVLLDDITTTGNSLFSCRQILLDNGFVNIYALTIFKEL